MSDKGKDKLFETIGIVLSVLAFLCILALLAVAISTLVWG